jgi:hypothetical protein
MSFPEGLSDFLIEAKQRGYGSVDANPQIVLGGAKEIVFANSSLVYKDTWVGGSPYAGFEFVSRLSQDPTCTDCDPIWAMSYRGGALNHGDLKKVNTWLGWALPNPDVDLPIRGPLEGIVNEYGKYQLESEGDLASFEAEERIYDDGRLIYVARFLGGVANL